MRLNLVGGVVAALVIVALIIAYGAMFTVYQTRQAHRRPAGRAGARGHASPGLHFKIPLIDSVIHIDNRILDLENPAQEVIASDQKRLVVDAFARYKITNPLRVLSDGQHGRRRQFAALDACSTRRCAACSARTR